MLAMHTLTLPMEKLLEKLGRDVEYIRGRLDDHIEQEHDWQNRISEEVGGNKSRVAQLSAFVSAIVAGVLTWIFSKM